LPEAEDLARNDFKAAGTPAKSHGILPAA